MQSLANKIITWQQYSKHIIPTDCWVLVGDYLYDVSDYLVEHPGGDDILLKYSGIDATIPFAQQKHSTYAVSLRDARLVGRIETPTYTQQYRLMLQQKKKQLREAKKSAISKKNPNRQLSWQQLSRHNSEKSCWVAISGNVYDVTDYLGSHPGGEGIVLQQAGKDATAAFKQANHSFNAIEKRNQFLIGKVIQKQSKGSKLIAVVAVMILLMVIGLFVMGKIEF